MESSRGLILRDSSAVRLYYTTETQCTSHGPFNDEEFSTLDTCFHSENAGAMVSSRHRCLDVTLSHNFLREKLRSLFCKRL